MKVFFDTNVYVAEALLGKGANAIIEGVLRARWRIYCNAYVVEETGHVLEDYLEFSERLVALARRRIIRRSHMVAGRWNAEVLKDPKDSPVLQGALACGADYLVSNDKHLLELDPFQSLRLVSLGEFRQVLKSHGCI